MAARVEITVDGRRVSVVEGTTLAAALFDLDVERMRTSVTGEPRSAVCGMGACHECRVTVNGVAHQRSCLIPCADGLFVETRATIPGPGGGNAAADGAALDRLTCDVAVIGGGPAGIAAASRAAERLGGDRVLVVDQGLRPGGQIWRHRDGDALPARARDCLARYERSGARWVPRTTVVGGSLDDGFVASDGSRALIIHARSAVIATGARELLLPFPGWTLPGVLGAGGAQALLKGGLRVSGRRVVVAGSGPLLLPVSAALARAGARVLAVAEQASATRVARFATGLVAHPDKLVEALWYRASMGAVRYRPGTWVARADGEGRVERVTLTDGHRRWDVSCDLLCCGYGLVPNLDLPRYLGCAIDDGRVVVDARQRTSVAGVFCAGEPTGVAGDAAALVEGEIAGLAAAGDDAGAASAARTRAREGWRRFADHLAFAFLPRDEVLALADADTVLCRCEDVRRGAVSPAWSARQAKLYTRIAMGPCQGAVCGAACQAMFGWSPNAVRMPVSPVTVGVVEQGSGFGVQGSGKGSGP